MTRTAPRKSPRLEDMVIISTIIHIILFVIFPQLLGLSLRRPKLAPTYYVDLVNLPVVNPQRGEPAAPEKVAERTAAPEKAVRLPEPAKKKAVPPVPDTKKQQAETEREFEERLAKLSRTAESRHQESAIEELKRKAAAGKARQGIPTGTGKEAGSDYAAYLQSRLKDAFEETISMQTKNPEVIIKLTVSRTGKITGYRIERSSGDRLFENSVARAIQLAGRNFPPPPGNEEFEGGFVFRPQGIRSQ